MEELVSVTHPLETPAEYEAAVESYLDEIRQLNERMQTDRNDIEQLKAEVQILKSETAHLRSEARGLLTQMGASF